MKEFHPLTEYIPTRADPMTLSMQIAHEGLSDPVVLYEKKIIEGRVRYQACLELGIEPQFKDWVLLAEGDPLDWMVRRHVATHELTELDRIRLVATLLPYYKKLRGQTEIQLRDATGLSNRKIRALSWMQEAGKLDPVLRGDIELLEAGRSLGIVAERRSIALGRNYGHGDKFAEAMLPPMRYFRVWKRKEFEFRHVNPKEAQRRLKILDELLESIEAAKHDLEQRAVRPRHTVDG